jgi:hypothetical protein
MMIAAAAMVFAGCQDSNDESSDDSSFMVEPSTMTFSAAAHGTSNEQQFALSTYGSWAATSNSDWCKVASCHVCSYAEGDGASTGIVYCNNANNTGRQRTAVITFLSGSSKRTITVTQLGQ